MAIGRRFRSGRRWRACVLSLGFAVAACGDRPTEEEQPESLRPPEPTAVLDARALGAVGDGVADDGPALQVAIEAAESLDTPLRIPASQAFYRVSRALQVFDATILGAGAEIRGSGEYVLRVDGPATIRGLKVVGRNGIEVHGGLFEDIQVIGVGDGVSPGDGWAVHGPTWTVPGGVTIRRAILRGAGTSSLPAYAIGLGDSSELMLEDVEATGSRWGAYVRSRSTLTATRTRFHGEMIGLELDRKPEGFPGLERFGSSDIVLTDCEITSGPRGLGWDLVVPFLAGLGHVVLAGSTNPTHIVTNYHGPEGDPPMGPPMGGVDDIIQRRR